jgi:hypothetical protein
VAVAVLSPGGVLSDAETALRAQVLRN